MKVFRRIKVFVLLFAVLAMLVGFSVLTTPNSAKAVNCTAWCMYCMLDPPYWCWCECCGWGTPPPPGP